MILKRNGATIDAPTGFSWTTLFFGVFVPLFRSDLFGFIILFLFAIFTGGLSWFFFPFVYNQMYVNGLKKQGWALDVK